MAGVLNFKVTTCRLTVKPRRAFVPAAQNLLNNLAGLGIRASQWINYRWNAEYCKNISRLCVFIPTTSARLVGMSLLRTGWVKFNHRLWTGVGPFHLFVHKWGLASSPKCECGTSEQTADHVLQTCPIHPAPQGAQGLTVLNDES